MKSLLQYINEDKFVGSSDRSVYLRLAQHKWNHMEAANKRGIERAKKEYPGIPNDRDQMIKWFKDSNGKLVSNDLEIIPRKDWNMLEQIGEIENSLMSPHKWTFFDYICKNKHKKNKTLVVFECCNSKPYCQDSAKKWYFSRFRSFCDFACGAYGIVPEEYSMLYPVREDEWAHSDESESVAFKYNLVSCNRGYQYIKAMDYDHVIVLFQNPDPEEFMKWMVNMPNMKDKLHFVVTKQLINKLKNEYPQLGNGLLVTRLVNLPATHEAFIKILKKCLKGDDLDRLKELEKLVKNDDKAGQKKWIEKTNEEFEIEEYKTDVPGFERKLKKSEISYHTYTSDIDNDLLNQYKDWLTDWAKKINNIKIGEDTDWFKQRLVFTPLDLLIDKYDLNETNPAKLDIDKCYWNMMKALEEVSKELKIERVHEDKYGRYKYLWCFSRVYDFINNKDLMKKCDEVGYSQFNQNVLDR